MCSRDAQVMCGVNSPYDLRDRIDAPERGSKSGLVALWNDRDSFSGAVEENEYGSDLTEP